MEGKKQTFTVTEHPPWYLNSDSKDEFRCESTQGLLNKVVNLMLHKEEELSESERRYKPENIYKTIRNMVIRDADTIQQKPSRSLLHALMDLVDIEGRNESMESVDKAGLKHELLANDNYTYFYIPDKELISTNGKKVIPVITQYSDKHNLSHYDRLRSMIGTYTTAIPTTGKGDVISCFMQKVLFVPGLVSLELLKEVTGNKFEFWDMTLEVPTHLTALTPSFQQIQPLQLLRNEKKDPSTQSSNDSLVSCMEDIHPMCCVPDPASAEMFGKECDAIMDCFTDKQVRCDLEHFHYKNGGTRTVYFRRNGEFLDGKWVNLVPVVTLRKNQVEEPELYVSTTVRFCRAVKHRYAKGNGMIESGCNATLQELQRETFITETHMFQEILYPASILTAFIMRLNPNSWCNYIPKHVETLMNPIMVEVVELASKLKDSKFPNAFAVAELLYYPIEKVQEYLTIWNMYASDNTMYMARAEELPKHDTSKTEDKQVVQLKDSTKALSSLSSNKLKKVGGEPGDPQSGSSSSHSTQAQDTDVSSECPLAEVEKHSQDEAGAGVGEKFDCALYSPVTPEAWPILPWIENMSTLLLSQPWLNNDNLRREAVCTLLGLDNTLLHERYSDILRYWVINNRTVVDVFKINGLKDRLSKALVDCLESMSTDNWRRRVMLSFYGTRDQPRGHSDQLVAKAFNEINPCEPSRPACSGTKEEIRGLKRARQSDSEESIEPDVKRVERTKEIDDTSTKEEYSSSDEEKDKDAPVERSTEKAECKTKNVKAVGKSKHMVRSEPSTPACSGTKQKIRGLKRARQSDSEEESIEPDAKRVKRAEETNDYKVPEKWEEGIEIKHNSPLGNTDSEPERSVMIRRLEGLFNSLCLS